MPTPPKESIGGRLATKLTENIKDKRKCFDLMMAAVIFVLTIIELRSFYVWTNSHDLIPEKYWNYYALNDYPFYNTVSFFVVSIFFLLKIIRYNSCIDTKLITILYFAIQFINLIFIIFKFGFPWYTETVYPIVLSFILFLLALKTVSWFGQK